jgi:hypothetical protein
MSEGQSVPKTEGSHGCTVPVEPEDELVEVVGQVFPAHAAVNAREPRLQVSEDPMDPREQCRGLLRRSVRRGPVVIPMLLERLSGAYPCQPSVRTVLPGATLASTNPTRDRPDTSGTTTSRIRPVPRPRTSTAATTIALLLSRFRPPPGPLPRRRHRSHPLRQCRRCGRARDGSSRAGVSPAWSTRSHAVPELPLELPRREPRRMRGHQVGSPEPIAQGHARPMHHRPRCDRGLVATRAALQQPPDRHRIGGRHISAPRTPILVRPPRLVSPAGALRSKTHLELGEGLREVGTRRPPVLLPHHNIWALAESTG